MQLLLYVRVQYNYPITSRTTQAAGLAFSDTKEFRFIHENGTTALINGYRDLMGRGLGELRGEGAGWGLHINASISVS